MKTGICLAFGFLCTSAYSAQHKVRLPDTLIKLIIETTPEEHKTTLASVAKYLRANQHTLHKDDKLLVQKQIARFEKFYSLLSAHSCHGQKAHPKLQALLLSMLTAEQQAHKKHTRHGKVMHEKMWTDFEYLFSKELHEKVSVQNFIIELVIQMVIISGESYTQQLFSDEDKATRDKLIKQIQAVQQQYIDKKDALSATTSNSITALAEGFQTALQGIQNTTGAAQTRLIQEMTYINRLSNISTQPQTLLIGQILVDQFYGASQMITPSNGYTWHNFYQKSDWEFDTQLGGFVQRGATGSQSGLIQQELCAQWQGETDTTGPTCTATGNVVVKADSNQGGQNYIFTEYYTTESPYTLEVEVTLINCIFPFCAGVMFNVGRWLSGNIQRMNQHRLVGLYGSQEGGKSVVGLYGGQTVFSDIGATTPLNYIVGDRSSYQPQAEPLYPLTDDDIKGLSQDPLTFVITISTSESEVYVNLDKVDASGNRQNLVSQKQLPIANPQQNQLMFWYHGIGFMSPGCQALFKIIQPQALTYTASQLQSFTFGPKKGKKKS
jgi:hypothetical protein